jgi:hypothetical protein
MSNPPPNAGGWPRPILDSGSPRRTMVLRHPTREYQPDRGSRTSRRTATRPADHTPTNQRQTREITDPHLTNHSPYQPATRGAGLTGQRVGGCGRPWPYRGPRLGVRGTMSCCVAHCVSLVAAGQAGGGRIPRSGVSPRSTARGRAGAPLYCGPVSADTADVAAQSLDQGTTRRDARSTLPTDEPAEPPGDRCP